MRKLLRYMRPYTKECVLGPLLKLAEATLELLVPLVMAAVIDRGIGSGDTSYAVWMCVLLAGLGVVGFVLSVVAQYFSAKAAVGFTARVRQVLFRHIQGLSYSAVDSVKPATLITRMTGDMNQVQSGVNLALRLLLRSPFVVFGAMVMAFTIDLPSALIFAVIIPLLAVVVFGIMLPCIPLYKKVQARLDTVLSRTRENLTGVRVIRAFRKEESESEEFERDTEQLTAAQNFVGRVSALLNPLTYVMINTAILVLLWTGAMRVEHAILTQGMVIALYNYMSQILVELIKLANLIINITKAIACGNRVAAVLDIPVAADAAEDAPAPVEGAPRVEWRDVTLRYHEGSDAALEHVSLTASAGEVLGIIGGTSAGKTSLVNLVLRFYDATEGVVAIDGVDVQMIPAARLRERIGIVPQQAVLFAGTVRDNLLVGNPDATDGDLWQALEAAQGAEMIREKPLGLDHHIEQNGRNLSGGQRQRLTIARALVRRPDILILDDSAAALDYATEAALRRAVTALPYHPTVLLISQRIASVQAADRIAVLEDGALIGVGTHDELMTACDVYREIHASQTREEVSDRG